MNPHAEDEPDTATPARGAPADELLSETNRSRVVRHRQRNGQCVIRKQVRGPEALSRVQHELDLLSRLADVPGVARPCAAQTGGTTLLLEDEGGQPLAQLLTHGALPLPRLLSIAAQLSRTVAGLHRAGVLHKDINPANIVLSRSEQTVLIDFHIASTFSDERPAFSHESTIAGTLAYMAPEQTGRTGRAVDQRSDLYALGATLYELATGRAPFRGEDLLTLIHQHLAETPIAPLAVRADLPQGLSDIIMRLLEKEPDHRYQSAEGLSHDLSRLESLIASKSATTFALGEYDFPRKLMPPSRLIGRTTEQATLRRAFEAAASGHGQLVLVAGSPGVGKSALINELRPWVTAQRGWYAAGKFDQYQPDSAGGAVVQALRQLGRLLLSEPDEALQSLRAALAANLGNNAAMLTASLPEFARILGPSAEQGVDDPAKASIRLRQGVVDLVRAVASPNRPLVLVIDDLQWAPASTMELIDGLQAEPLPGLLLVGAYRAGEVDTAHPLGARLARWIHNPGSVVHLTLANLPPASVAELLQDMLRLPRADATRLAQAVGMRTAGNPYDTVELINALRREGALSLTEQGWRWDAQVIRQFVGKGEVVDLLSARIERLPKPTRNLLEMLACLGSEVKTRTLSVASGLSAEAVNDQLRPALEEGLVQRELASPSGALGDAQLRFRHDRVQQAAYRRIDRGYLRVLHLALARRLATDPDMALFAAQQYMPALVPAADAPESSWGHSVLDPEERGQVIELLHRMGQRASIVNYPVAERYLSAALVLLDSLSAPAHRPARSVSDLILTELHAALYALGRQGEADAIYERLVAGDPEPDLLTSASQVQIHSLLSRLQARKAVALGMGLLSRLGLPQPENVQAELTQGIEQMRQWAASIDETTPIDRPEISDPAARRLAKIVRSTQLASAFVDHVTHTWLVLQSLRLWQTYGPHPALVASLVSTSLILSGDIANAQPSYEVIRHLLRLGEARNYEPEVSWTRHLFTVTSQPWLEPIDEGLSQSMRARAGLLQGGDLQGAAFTFYQAAIILLDSGQSLEGYVNEVDAGQAFEARSGGTILNRAWLAMRQFGRAMRGQTRGPGSFSEGDTDEDSIPINPKLPTLGTANFHSLRALSAALYGDSAALITHAAAGMRQLAVLPGFYTQTHIRLMQAMAQAEQARQCMRSGAGDAAPETDGLDGYTEHLSALDKSLAWMRERARLAPSNFLHLQHLIEAELAWARNKPWDATHAYERAMRAVPKRGRPWQQAYITERAGLFHRASGMEATGRMLLAQARALYLAWGATGKVRHMAQQHAFLRHRFSERRAQDSLANHEAALARQAKYTLTRPEPASTTAGDVVDMHALLHASQQLSAETRLDTLAARLAQVLNELTGATRVTLLVHDVANKRWSEAGTPAEAAPWTTQDKDQARRLALSALRYVERTLEALIVPDAKRDDRFAQDPYIAPLPHCSLLLQPIVHHGDLRAALILENNLSRGAFSDDRLDAVSLIAGQLAVSIENAQLYGSLERKVAQRTEALAEANHRLEQLSVTDPLTALFNRRRFTETIELEWKRSLRSRSPIGLLMIDIDQFKRYNDHYGHQGGDICLRRVAQLLTMGLHRATDFLARYGGEEFVVVLPATDLPGTLIVAERLRLLVASAMEPHADADHGIVTISQGATAFIPESTSSWSEHLEAADQALYRAKEGGRNRVEAAKQDLAP